MHHIVFAVCFEISFKCKGLPPQNRFFFSTNFCFGLFFFHFRYSWQSYSYMIRKSDQNFRVVSNCFRMVHAYISSAPLMLINLSILMNETKGIHNQEPAIDLRKLPSKMKDLNIYGSAIFLSLLSFLRGVSIFNERETKIMLFAPCLL